MKAVCDVLAQTNSPCLTWMEILDFFPVAGVSVVEEAFNKSKTAVLAEFIVR